MNHQAEKSIELARVPVLLNLHSTSKVYGDCAFCKQPVRNVFALKMNSIVLTRSFKIRETFSGEEGFYGHQRCLKKHLHAEWENWLC